MENEKGGVINTEESILVTLLIFRDHAREFMLVLVSSIYSDR
jgi:hypothetical protein